MATTERLIKQSLHSHCDEYIARLETDNERLRAHLEDIRRYALSVVGAAEAYGETESAHLWQEVADLADQGRRCCRSWDGSSASLAARSKGSTASLSERR